MRITGRKSTMPPLLVPPTPATPTSILSTPLAAVRHPTEVRILAAPHSAWCTSAPRPLLPPSVTHEPRIRHPGHMANERCAPAVPGLCSLQASHKPRIRNLGAWRKTSHTSASQVHTRHERGAPAHPPGAPNPKPGAEEAGAPNPNAGAEAAAGVGAPNAGVLEPGVSGDVGKMIFGL